MRFIRLSLLCLIAAACTEVACSGDLSPLPAVATPTTTSPAPTTPPTSLVGRVVQQGTGTGIAAARLTLVDPSDNATSGTTDAAGGFEFDNLANGTYSLRVVADGFVPSASTLTFPVSSYTVQLAPVGQPQAVGILNLTIAGPSTVTVGRSTQLTATATYTDGSTLDVSTVAKWSIGLPVIATISQSGLVTAYASGTSTVTATFGSLSAGFVLTATAP